MRWVAGFLIIPLIMTTVLFGDETIEGAVAYTWHKPEVDSPNLIPMVWASGGEHNVLLRARQVAAELRSRPEGHRVLFLKGFINSSSDIAMRDPVELFRFGPRIGAEREYYRTLFRRLHEIGVEPDMVVLDEEHSIGIWGLSKDWRLDWFQTIYRNKALLNKHIPKRLHQYEPTDFVWRQDNPREKEAVIAWNQFANRWRADMLRQAIAEPAWYWFGEDTLFSNYQNRNFDPRRYDLRDKNNFPRGNVAIQTPAPALYTSIGPYDKQVNAPPAWSAFCRAISDLRANGPKATPWVSAVVSRRAQPRRTLALMAHGVKMGIDRFLLFNPHAAPNEKPKPNYEAAIAAILERLEVGEPNANLPFVPRDAEKVTTGSLTTTPEHLSLTEPEQ